jgi:hypothetical protein
MNMTFLISIEVNTKYDKIRKEILRGQVEIQRLLTELEEKLLQVWSYKMNGQNQDTERGKVCVL